MLKLKGGISAGISTHNWVIRDNDLEMDLWAGAGNEIKEYVLLEYSTWILPFEAHILNYQFINVQQMYVNQLNNKAVIQLFFCLFIYRQGNK